MPLVLAEYVRNHLSSDQGMWTLSDYQTDGKTEADEKKLTITDTRLKLCHEPEDLRPAIWQKSDIGTLQHLNCVDRQALQVRDVDEERPALQDLLPLPTTQRCKMSTARKTYSSHNLTHLVIIKNCQLIHKAVLMIRKR